MLRPHKSPHQILEEAYQKALTEFEKDRGRAFIDALPDHAKSWIIAIGTNPEKHKAAVSVLTTLLTKKIETPGQDIRYHRTDLPKGFSGRSYDTRYITPFIKDRFGTKFAMKESGWLTRAFEKPEAYKLDYTGKITPEYIKSSFLHILDDVEKRGSKAAEEYLIALFICLLRRKAEVEALASKKKTISDKETTINLISQILREHFNVSPASRLPVIAVYAVYKRISKEAARYEGKKLNPLRTHISPDLYAGVGDVEVIDEEGRYFEVVEVKYGRPIDVGMLNDVYGKIKGKNVQRYYLLTTAHPYIKSEEAAIIQGLIDKVKNECGCEVIINGVIPTIQYYLRLLRRPSEFIEHYTQVLREEYEKRAEITDEHLKAWEKLLKEKIWEKVS